MTTKAYITPELFQFFRELKVNNNRDWFQANKMRYETQVREPLLQFITDFGLRLAEVSPHYVADARKSGGSLFRINRDVRFSKDKSPYKTAAGIQFRHEVSQPDVIRLVQFHEAGKRVRPDDVIRFLSQTAFHRWIIA